MNIEEMKKRKKELGYTYEKIAELSGVPLGTVQKIFGGVTDAPRYDTLCALEKIFKPEENLLVREAGPNYNAKKQGEYTLDDYYAIPDEQRVELIDGVFYDMSAPTSIHQIIAGEIYRKFGDFVHSHKGLCVPIMSPIGVQLDCDNRTMVQPDVIVVCNRNKIQGPCIYGAPDLVVEILSKSTRRKDMFLKLNKYMNAGVREYWMIDPDRQQVVVYDFEHDEYPVIYGFESKIPTGIFDKECIIDFGEIYEYVKFLYV